ncbi:MAG TPA: PH domain-containing protein [Phycisphaerales bacterium]
MAESVRPGAVERASAWVYEGIWGVVSGLLLVPREPPLMPTVGERSGVEVLRLKPGEAYLRYRKFWFWIGLTAVDVALVIFWLVIAWRFPIAGVVIAIPMLVLIVLPDVVAYVAIQLRYDTTWYVITDRSMRLRSGVWTMHEMTLTFENVQNVEIRQGPVERHFGIATLQVETAGGGVSHTQHGPVSAGNNVGRLVGLENAAEVREWVMQRVRASRSSGLGDEIRVTPAGERWSGAALEELRRIRAALE